VASLLVLGALGAVAAAWSGEEEDEKVGNVGVAAATVLEEHEMRGERTRNRALLVAVFPMASVLLFRCTRLSRGLGVATAIGAEVSAVAGQKPDIMAANGSINMASVFSKQRRVPLPRHQTVREKSEFRDAVSGKTRKGSGRSTEHCLTGRQKTPEGAGRTPALIKRGI